MAPGGLRQVADGVWIAAEPVRFLGLHLTATMAVLRLTSGRLLVWSPVALPPTRVDAIAALGEVGHVYAPNLFHHLWLDDAIAAWPDAAVHAPRDLPDKHPGLRVDRCHDDPLPAELSAGLDELAVDGFRLDERVLFHRASATLLVADLVHHVGRPEHPWTVAYTKAMGFYDQVAVSRIIRWTSFSDRAAAAASLAAILALPFERIVVGHGEPITDQPRDSLRLAYDWLVGGPA